MKQNKYVELGKTKMVDIDYAICIPHLQYFLSVNMMFEFTSMGQVIPTRIDVMPYKLSPFTKYKEDSTSFIDGLKFLLVLYTFYAVADRYKTYARQGKFWSDFGPNLLENFIDILIVTLQTLCFAIKIQDSIAFDINPEEILD